MRRSLMTKSQPGAICVWACVLGLRLCSVHAAAATFASYGPSRDDRVASAVVQLLAVGPGRAGQNQECSATGFLVNGEGYILTNAHVVKKAQECLAKTPDSKIVAKFARRAVSPADTAPQVEFAAASVSCELVGLDEIHDLAVLKTERPPGILADSQVPRVVLESTEVSAGATVAVTGHPAFAWDAVTQSGHILGRKNLRLSERSVETTEVLVLDIPLRGGSSGSPVFETGGGVVGVVEGQDPSNASRTVAVPIRYAIDLLNRLGVKWDAAPEQREHSARPSRYGSGVNQNCDFQ
jgi:serine protease Do